MPKKKVYAVRKGLQTGLFYTWAECKKMVHGFPGAVYKSFETKEEADAYLQGASAQAQGGSQAARKKQAQPAGGKQAQVQTVQEKEAAWHTDGKHLTAYVDGSFDKKRKRYSFGCVLLTPDGEIIRESGSGNDPESLALRNVSGEMLGAMHAVKWAIQHGYASVEICYDYAGIEQWATHGWKANKERTRQYADYMERCSSKIQITFTKIAAHTGIKYNEEADQLAKKALQES